MQTGPARYIVHTASGGEVGAVGESFVEPGLGTAAGGVGGIGGYLGASWAVGEAYDWVEETCFESVPEVAAP